MFPVATAPLVDGCFSGEVVVVFVVDVVGTAELGNVVVVEPHVDAAAIIVVVDVAFADDDDDDDTTPSLRTTTTVYALLVTSYAVPPPSMVDAAAAAMSAAAAAARRRRRRPEAAAAGSRHVGSQFPVVSATVQAYVRQCRYIVLLAVTFDRKRKDWNRNPTNVSLIG